MTTLSLSINLAAARHNISPFIYGINGAMNDTDFTDLIQAIKPPVVRWGGNATTRYNWQNDFYNTGKDWYFENIPCDNPDRSELPNNSAADRFIQRNKTAGSESLITVPLIGWVAKAKPENDPNPLGHPYDSGFKVSKYGLQTSTDPYDPDSDCGNGVRKEDNSLIRYNYPADTSIAINPDFVNKWVNHLVEEKPDGTLESDVRFYGLDNEPGIWFETHRDVFPGYLNYEEFLQRTIDYATAIRQADPNAQILGPVQDGWMRYFYSSYGGSDDLDEAAEKDRAKHGQAFVAWYLAKLSAYERQTGKRTIDYFDLHYYPQAENKKLSTPEKEPEQIALSPAGEQSTQELRLRSTRSLWDENYVDESWIYDTEDEDGIRYNTAVKLIPRMRAWVKDNYPSLKLAISEYNWGAIDHINGAVAQADVLGIFGREDVGLATLWCPPSYDKDGNEIQPALDKKHPAAFAFLMYRNYDGKGSQFGDVSISATSADQEKLAIYAAERSSDRALTLMIINKSFNDLEAPIDLGGFPGGNYAQHYQYSDTNLLSIVKQSDLLISNGVINGKFKAQSINLLIIARS